MATPSANETSDTAGIWEIDLSKSAHLVTLSKSWQNSRHDNDIYDMPRRSDNCGVSSRTSKDQFDTEGECVNKIKRWLLTSDIQASAYLARRKTIEYLINGTRSLPRGYSSQDCSRTWVVYWILNSMFLLNADAYINDSLQTEMINFLKKCQVPGTGGFGGGPMQYGHVAASFGAVMALMTIGTKEAYDAIDREGFYKFLLSLKQPDGSFCTQVGGEIDIRAIYCGLACAALLNILDAKLCENSIDWLNSCQTYQGGFSQEKNDEAHGGYAYCGVATIIIIKMFLSESDQKLLGIDQTSVKSLFADFDGMLRWAVMKQMSYSGGFCGRTNKLVDACYSFWVGALFPMINIIEAAELMESKASQAPKVAKDTEPNDEQKDEQKDAQPQEQQPQEQVVANDAAQTEAKTDENGVDQSGWDWFDVPDVQDKAYFDTMQLQKYLLIVAQYHSGGITDKPPKPADYYHTCYGLSGLAIAQSYGKLLGPATNKLNRLDPVFGILCTKAKAAREYFCKLPKIQPQQQNQK